MHAGRCGWALTGVSRWLLLRTKEMDKLFDEISRIVASPIPRRRVMRLVFGGVASALVIAFGTGRVEADNCNPACPTGQTCCNGVCCQAGQVCCNKVCCTAGQTCCGNQVCCGTVCCNGQKCCAAGDVCCDQKCRPP